MRSTIELEAARRETVPDAAEFKMLQALAVDAVRDAALHGEQRLRFHRYWLRARRAPSSRECFDAIRVQVGRDGDVLDECQIDVEWPT